MTVQEMLDALDDYGFVDTETDRKLQMVNDSYYDVLGRFPWPFMVADVNASADVSGKLSYTGVTVARVLYLQRASQLVRQITAEEYYKTIHGKGLGALQSDRPKYWYQVGGDQYVWPIPASPPLNLTALLRKRPNTLLSTDAETAILIPKNHHRVVMLGALWRLYALEDDLENITPSQSEYEQLIQNMANELMVRPAPSPRAEPRAGKEVTPDDSAGNDHAPG
jgi:hypothetical protein